VTDIIPCPTCRQPLEGKACLTCGPVPPRSGLTLTIIVLVLLAIVVLIALGR